MSDTPKTDALDAAYTKMLDSILAAGGPSSMQTVVEAARTMMVGYGRLCDQLESDLTVCRAVTKLCCEKNAGLAGPGERVYLLLADNCLWLHWPEGMINLTHLVGTESIGARRDIAHAPRYASQNAAPQDTGRRSLDVGVAGPSAPAVAALSSDDQAFLVWMERTAPQTLMSWWETFKSSSPATTSPERKP